MMKEKATTKFRKMINGDKIIVAPACWDCASAILIQKAGFDALDAGSAHWEASITGTPDAEINTLTEREQLVANIAEVVDIPMFVDIDTGMGHPVQIMRTVRKMEKAGAAGIYIEDQQIPKGCGHWKGRRIISEEEMKFKLAACFEGRQDEDFVIIAKVCSIPIIGFDKTIERAKNFEKAGADVIMIEAPTSVEQLKVIASEFKRSCVNVVTKGVTPVLTIEEYQEMGFKIAKFGGAYCAYLNAVQDYLNVLKTERTDKRLFSGSSTYTLKDGNDPMWELTNRLKFEEYYRKLYPSYAQ